jgi:hypothetical protein
MYVLAKRPSKEWSAALFWQLNDDADIENPETLDIKVDHMFLQDLGSTVYTEFEHDDVAGHIMDNEELMEYRVGLIHSHHTMQAFFSGTDTEELHEKAKEGLYLSLIVNNHMEPVCKLAWMGQVERKIETFNSWDLGRFIRKPKKVTKTEIANVFYEVQMEINWHESISTIADRYDELKAEETTISMAKSIEDSRSAFQGDMFGKIGKTVGDKSPVSYNRNPIPNADDKKAGISFTDKLVQNGIIQSCMGAVLTQNPKTGLGFVGGLSEAMNTVKETVTVMNDANKLGSKDFMEAYKDECTEYAEVLIKTGEDILAEKLGEFFLTDEDYHDFLNYFYKIMERDGSGVLVKELMTQIIDVVLEDEDDIETASALIEEGDAPTGKELTDARIEEHRKENEEHGINNRFML